MVLDLRRDPAHADKLIAVEVDHVEHQREIAPLVIGREMRVRDMQRSGNGIRTQPDIGRKGEEQGEPIALGKVSHVDTEVMRVGAENGLAEAVLDHVAEDQFG